MKKILFVLILCIIIFFLAGRPDAEMYRYIDDKGQVLYTNVPPNDERSTGAVEKVKPKGGVTIMGTQHEEPEAQTTRAISLIDKIKEKLGLGPDPDHLETEQADKQEFRENQVDLYVTSWCGYCERARKFLISKGIDFNEYDIEKDEEAARRKRELDGRRGVPFAVINGRKIHGWSQSAYERALNLN